PNAECNIFDVLAMQDQLSVENAHIVSLSTKAAAQGAGAIQGGAFVANDQAVPEGCYLYVGLTIVDGDTGPAGSDFGFVPLVVGSAADTTAPFVGAVSVNDTEVVGTLDAGDTVAVTLSEQGNTLADDATITFLDADGTV